MATKQRKTTKKAAGKSPKAKGSGKRKPARAGGAVKKKTAAKAKGTAAKARGTAAKAKATAVKAKGTAAKRPAAKAKGANAKAKGANAKAKGAAAKTRKPAAKSSKPAMPEGPTMPLPAIGDEAPALNLPTDSGTAVSLADFRGRSAVIVYFYPRADTPGCTKEACAFQADLPDFAAHGAVVVGVSPDGDKALGRFRNKYNLTFALAADEGAATARQYGVWVEKSMYGRRYMGIQRSTFLIDRDGRVARVWPDVRVEGHSADVLAAVKSLPR
jgi:peroxiredoxin Q/BCP